MVKTRLMCTACHPYKLIVRGQFLDHIRDNHPEIYLHYIKINQANYMELHQ